jgi:hypothetical protein
MKRIPGIHYDYIEGKYTDNPIAEYVKQSKRVFETGSQRDDDTNKPLVNHLDPYVRMRFGYLLRMGANKYEKNNWQKGQPDEAALESLHRHLAKYELGDRKEDHLSAIIFNVQLLMKNEQMAGINIDQFYIPIKNENKI